MAQPGCRLEVFQGLPLPVQVVVSCSPDRVSRRAGAVQFNRPAGIPCSLFEVSQSPVGDSQKEIRPGIPRSHLRRGLEILDGLLVAAWFETGDSTINKPGSILRTAPCRRAQISFGLLLNALIPVSPDPGSEADRVQEIEFQDRAVIINGPLDVPQRPADNAAPQVDLRVAGREPDDPVKSSRAFSF